MWISPIPKLKNFRDSDDLKMINELSAQISCGLMSSVNISGWVPTLLIQNKFKKRIVKSDKALDLSELKCKAG